MSNKKKKLPTYRKGDTFGKQASNFGMAMLDNMLTTVTSGAAANVIKQDQYDDTAFGRSLGETQALKESMDSMSPIAKMSNKFIKNQETGYNTKQQELYNTAQPVAQFGSSIGEMWAGKGLNSIGGKRQVDPNTGKEIPNTGQSLGIGNMASSGMSQSPGQGKSLYRGGGISYPTNAIPIHGGNWAIPIFPGGGRFVNPNNGIPNAEIEKQEVVNHPSGGIQAFDLNSHENATDANRINLEPGAKILSDTIKNPLTKKPFAQEAKRFDTSKEEKILSNSKASKTAKKSAKLNMLSKKTLFDQTFEFQEMLNAQKEYNSQMKKAVEAFKNGGYKLYQEGGPHTNPIKPAGYNAVLVNPNQLTPEDKFIQRNTEDLGGGRTKVTNLYSKTITNKPVPSSTPGKTPSSDWEASMIKRVQAGENPAELEKMGFFGPEGTKKFSPYYKPLKTEVIQEAPKQDARLYGEKTIAGKIQPKGYAEQPWETYRTWPEAGKANVYNDVNYYQGKPIDLTKSFDSSGNFKPVYLDSNATGTYLQQQGTEMNRNTLPTLNKDTRNMMSYSVNRYGGVQKFDKGGTKKSKNQQKWENSLVFKPTMYEDTGDYPTVYPTQQGNPVLEATDPRFRQSYPTLNDTQAELLVNSAKAYKPEQPTQDTPKGSNWKNTAYQVGTGLASNMGELYAMYKASKPVEVQKRYDYTPKLLNNTAAERAAWRMYKNTADSLKSAGLSSGQYISNLSANRARLTEQLDESRINRENVNAGIENQAQQYNIAGKYAVDDINAKNRAAKENLQLKATERMGTNFAQQSKDYRATEQERQMLPFLQKAFSDPAFQEMFAKWMASQGVA